MRFLLFQAVSAGRVFTATSPHHARALRGSGAEFRLWEVGRYPAFSIGAATKELPVPHSVPQGPDLARWSTVWWPSRRDDLPPQGGDGSDPESGTRAGTSRP